LGIATFTIVATTFAPTRLLSSIATDLGRSPATVGLIVTNLCLARRRQRSGVCRAA